MNTIRLFIWKEFSHIKADPLMSRLIIFPVLAQIFIMGYALTTEVKNTPVAIVDRSNTTQSRSLIHAIQNNDLFLFHGDLQSETEARQLLDNGTIRVALIIPSDFASAMRRTEGASVQLLVDGQDANSSNVASGYMNAIISQWMIRQFKNLLAARGIDIGNVIPVTITQTVLFNPMLKSTWYMIPALVVLLVTMITALLTGFSIVKEKEQGTFEQLMVTPVKPMHVLFGKIIPFVIIGLAEIAAFLFLAVLWFRIPFRGSVITVFGFGLLYMISSLGIGIFTSTVARTSQQVLFLTWFILIFFILLSGFFVPVENMPHWVQLITYVNPVRFFMFAVRETFLKGSGFGQLWREALVISCIGVTVFSMALITFHRKAV